MTYMMHIIIAVGGCTPQSALHIILLEKNSGMRIVTLIPHSIDGTTCHSCH